MLAKLKKFWQGVRRVSGDDAYEQYLKHYAVHHSGEGEPLSRADFFKAWQEKKWTGIKRCC